MQALEWFGFSFSVAPSGLIFVQWSGSGFWSPERSDERESAGHARLALANL
jgi:hypothetical protein